MKVGDRKQAYKSLMKYGLSKNYWNEYIFLSHRELQKNMILLEGFPDISSMVNKVAVRGNIFHLSVSPFLALKNENF